MQRWIDEIYHERDNDITRITVRENGQVLIKWPRSITEQEQARQRAIVQLALDLPEFGQTLRGRLNPDTWASTLYDNAERPRATIAKRDD